jgi:competence protein ComFB
MVLISINQVVFFLQLVVYPIKIFLRDNMNCTVRNANYERVLSVMDKFVKERYKDVCSCPRCVNDIAAIALNFLPPHYYVDSDDSKDIGSPWVMVETAVVEAIDRVIENPNHPGQTHHATSPVPPVLTS